jgi:phosphogluconate dehydratase
VVFDDQDALIAAFERGELDRDLVAVVRFQGPMANGMPELHSLSPTLGVLMDRGFKVALVTDGRMSGASGKVLAALHVTPEAGADGPLAYVSTGDVICVDAANGRLDIRLDPGELRARRPARAPAQGPGYGRELFAHMRSSVGSADTGACTLF